MDLSLQGKEDGLDLVNFIREQKNINKFRLLQQPPIFRFPTGSNAYRLAVMNS